MIDDSVKSGNDAPVDNDIVDVELAELGCIPSEQVSCEKVADSSPQPVSNKEMCDTKVSRAKSRKEKKEHALKMAMIPIHEKEHRSFYSIAIGAAGMAMNAGFINGVTVQAGKITVTNVTGVSTQLGLAVGGTGENAAIFYLIIVLCYTVGGMVCGIAIPHQSFYHGSSYGPILILIAMLLFASYLCALLRPSSLFYFYFATVAVGMQNGMTSKYSGNICRTTHMTGAATDIGLTLGQWIRGHIKDIWKLQILLPLYTCFVLGAAVSIPVYELLGMRSIIVSAIIYVICGVAYIIVHDHHLKFVGCICSYTDDSVVAS
jgi:uncharacterized membrane protein YoaK (UPF0700 family)